MIKTEQLTVNGKEFVRTYSDTGLQIERDGVLYAEAVDPADSGRVYNESDQLIEPVPEEEEDMEVSE